MRSGRWGQTRTMRTSGAGRMGTSANLRYQQRVLAIADALPIIYSPMMPNAADASGNGRTVTPSNVTFGQSGIGDGQTAASFNGTSSKIDWNSAGLRTAYNGGAEWSFNGWVRSSEWDTAAVRFIFLIRDFSGNQIGVRKDGINKLLFDVFTVAGGSRSHAVWIPTTDYFDVGITLSTTNGRVRFFYNGALASHQGYTAPVPMLACGLGAEMANNNNFWLGDKQHCAMWAKELSPDKMRGLASVPARPRAVGIIGDSISASTSRTWPYYLVQNYGMRTGISNHAIGGHSIMANLAAQVTASQYDDADDIIIALGTNDNTATGVQAEVTTRVNALKLTNPRARIFIRGILPCTAGIAYAAGAVNAINAALQAAAEATGTIYVPTNNINYGGVTYNTATHTSDGQHPNAIGAQLIADWSRTTYLAGLPA